MKERPTLFSGSMVRAILEGRKTQTRRVINPQPEGHRDGAWRMETGAPYPIAAFCFWHDIVEEKPDEEVACPYGAECDRLWVRETWRAIPLGGIKYRADGTETGAHWKPSIFMPRWASRITLEITDVRVQRVQDISTDDVIAEGVDVFSSLPVLLPRKLSGEKLDHLAHEIAVSLYKKLWDSINAKRGYGWDANPWVWAITFKRANP